MDALPEVMPDVTNDPVVLHDGALCLRLGPRTIPLRLGREPVTAFVPGWRPTFLYTGFDPFLLLQFSSESGETAAWIVDADGLRLGGSLGELEAETREALRASATPRVAQLATAVLQQPVLALDHRSRAFLMLPEGLRRDIGRLCAATTLPSPRRVLLDAVPDQWDSEWGLNRAHVETLLATPFQNRVLLVAQDGMLSWPSPVDGRTLMVQGSLCSDDFRFAYRLADVEYGLVCYPIVSHHHSTTLGLFLPSLNLVVVRDGWAAEWLDVYAPSLTDWLVTLVCRFGDLLERYFEFGSKYVASIMRGRPGTHLGHQLWNELAGIDQFLEASRGPHLPVWIVPGAEVELWGPIEEIFPQIRGSVDRSADRCDLAIRTSYETGACLVRITSSYVSAGLRASLRRCVEADPVDHEVRQALACRSERRAPVVVLGLRVENRTIIDLLEFCEELLVCLANAFPGTTIILDGHNSGSDGHGILSHGEPLARQPPLAVERGIARHLKRLQAGRDITVVSALNASIYTSLAWCAHADCFIAIWGASLSKYRWACNLPGLVVTSKWNLRHRADLRIYDSPEAMEAPTELSFVDAEAVTDLPGAPLLVDVLAGQESFFNFSVDADRVFSQVLGTLRNRMAEPEVPR